MIIKNARVLNQSFVFEHKDLYTKGELISAPYEADSMSECIDASGLTVLPGLVDIHFHGASGCDFMDADADSLRTIAAYEARHGVTSICPASMTMSFEAIERAVKTAAEFSPSDNMASLLGVYMEGPFVSRLKLGAQNSEYVSPCSIEFFSRLQSVSKNLIKAVVVAPETEGAMEFIKEVSKSVTVSLGHTDCSYETAAAAFLNGARGLTHTFNAMNPLHHRNPGPIAAASDCANVHAELISDGVHVHESMIRALYRLCPDRVVLISDSMSAAGLEDGEYSLGGLPVYVKGNRATLGDGTLAGSVTNLFDCMRHAVSSGIALETAVKSASFNPARAVGCHDRAGSIREGAMADLLLIDDSLELKGVILRGKVLFLNI